MTAVNRIWKSKVQTTQIVTLLISKAIPMMKSNTLLWKVL